MSKQPRIDGPLAIMAKVDAKLTVAASIKDFVQLQELVAEAREDLHEAWELLVTFRNSLRKDIESL